MKRLLLALALLLTAGGAGLFVNGNLPSTAKAVPTGTLPSFEAIVPMPRTEQPGTAVVFKWQDDSGVWHYGDTAPAGANPQTLTLDTGTIDSTPRQSLAPTPAPIPAS